jgi:hypothetical protein
VIIKATTINKAMNTKMIKRFKRVTIPAILVLVLTIGFFTGTSQISASDHALTSKCTLSILSGNVEIYAPRSNLSQKGTDGMTLDTGDRVKTLSDSSALLTFFDGSTLKLEPNTEIEIEKLNISQEKQSITVIIKQLFGNTWSHVAKMANPHYEIKTPSAVALVRGTQFLTEVDDLGATKVLTAEGLVSVSAQEKEIFLPAGQQTEVEPGTPPSEPRTVDVSKYIKNFNSSSSKTSDYETNQGQNTDQSNGQSNSNSQSSDNVNGNANGQGNTNGQSNSNGQSNANGQSNSNSQSSDNGNGNANGQSNSNSQSSDNVNGNANGQGNTNGQSNSNGQSNANGQSNSNSQSSDNGSGNANDPKQSNNNGQDKTPAPSDPTPKPTTTPPGKSDKTK